MPARTKRYIWGVICIVLSVVILAVFIGVSDKPPILIKILAVIFATIIFVISNLSIGKLIDRWQISRNPALHKNFLDLDLPLILPGDKTFTLKRPKDIRRWRIIWRLIRGWVEQGKSTGQIEVALRRNKFSQVPCKETLDKIIAAGLAGELNDPPQSS